MPKKIDWASVRRDFIEGDLTYSALASVHGLSRQSVEKRGSDEGWQALRQTFRREQSIEVEKIEENNRTDFDSLLTRAIALSFAQLERSEARNFEGACDAFCKLAEIQLKLRPPAPPSVEQWAELALEFGLPASELFKEIKKKWGNSK